MNNNYFHIRFSNVTSYKEGHILRCVQWGVPVIILKVYKPTWWRKLLKDWGFNVRINEIKVTY